MGFLLVAMDSKSSYSDAVKLIETNEMSAIEKLELVTGSRFDISIALDNLKDAFLLLSKDQRELGLLWAAYVESHFISKRSDFALLCSEFLTDINRYNNLFDLTEDDILEITNIVLQEGLAQY